MLFTYYHPHGRALWLPFGWNVVFVIINLLHIIYYMYNKYLADHLKPEEEELLNFVFDYTGISRLDFLSLVRAGTWEDYSAGTQLTSAGSPNPRVIIVYSGRAQVEINGEKVYVLDSGNFIGEMGLHVGLHISTPLTSSATVTAITPMKCLVWSRGALIDLLEKNSSLQRCMQSSITADLMRKLKANSKFKDSVDESNLHEKSHYEYANLLSYVLSKSEITAHDRNILKRYRSIHLINDAAHVKYVLQKDWTLEEFDQGHKGKKDAVIQSKTSHPLMS